MPPLTAIIILNWNGREDTLACLRSLAVLDVPRGGIGVFVADNGSTDGSQKTIATALDAMTGDGWRELRLLPLGINFGFTGGNNRALDAVPPEYTFTYLSNNDIIFLPHTLAPLMRLMADDPRVGACGPRTLKLDSPEELAHGAGFLNPLLCGTRSVNARVNLDCDFITGCALMLRRGAIHDAGGLFDTRFFAYWEDTDLCLRIRKAGYRCVYCPGAEVLHRVGAALAQDAGTSPARIYHDIRSRTLFAGKHLSIPALAIHHLLYAIKLPMFAVRALVGHPADADARIQAYWRGWLDGLRGGEGKPYTP